MQAPTFKVLTFNTWLLRLPFGVALAAHVNERARLLPDAVQAAGADIAIVQEVWEPKMKAKLRREFARRGYVYEASASVSHPLFGELPGPHARGLAGSAWILPLSALPFHPTSSAWLATSTLYGSALAGMATSSLVVQAMRRSLGNGLQIFSRFELSPQVDTMAFSSWTRPDEVFTSKGAIRVGAKVPGLGWIDVYDSHLGAVSYEPHRNAFHPKQVAQRKAQTVELCRWMESTRTCEFGVLGVDLNAAPSEPDGEAWNSTHEYRLLTDEENLNLQDTYVSAGPTHDTGNTDDASNPYRVTGHFKNSPNCRIDYVFARKSGRARPTGSQVVFRETPACDTALSLSDHYGVLTEFSVEG